jgi:hypothetical protein
MRRTVNYPPSRGPFTPSKGHGWHTGMRLRTRHQFMCDDRHFGYQRTPKAQSSWSALGRYVFLEPNHVSSTQWSNFRALHLSAVLSRSGSPLLVAQLKSMAQTASRIGVVSLFSMVAVGETKISSTKTSGPSMRKNWVGNSRYIPRCLVRSSTLMEVRYTCKI